MRYFGWWTAGCPKPACSLMPWNFHKDRHDCICGVRQMTATKTRIALLTGAVVALAVSFALPAQTPAAPATGVKVQKDVPIPMSDGVKLGGDIYLPDGPGPFPVMLCRTPYNKNGQAQWGNFFAQHGYATVVVDSRGLNASSGTWH